jgi:hypothetical protein
MRKFLLIGDNPFHGVSHLAQARARERSVSLKDGEYAADLVLAALRSGADGFMFTVSDVTLWVIRALSRNAVPARTQLYALVPNATQLVRMAAASGGVPGLGRALAMEVTIFGGLAVLGRALKGIVAADAGALLEAYLLYELRRLRSVAPKLDRPVCLLLHEVVTDTALALRAKWLFSEHMRFCTAHGIRPGFETRNFAYLVKELTDWEISLRGLVIAAPFNRIGFQMAPSRERSEEVLAGLPHGLDVIAFSVLAGGYLGVLEAAEYVASLPNVRGVVVGISKREHVDTTVRVLREVLDRNVPVAATLGRRETK